MTKVSQRALLTWQVLIAKATDRQTITYESLAVMVGMQPLGKLAVRHYLNRVANYCLNNNLPDLTIVVVALKRGRPAYVSDGVDVDAEREKVFAHKWFAEMPPTLGDLA